MEKVPPFDKVGITPIPDWQNADPGNGIPGSILNVAFMNAVQGELLNVIDGAGLARNSVDLTQLLQAIPILVRSKRARQVYSTAGTYTWTCPVGVTRVFIRLWGAGGGGSGGGNAAGCGGGYSDGWFTVVPGTTYTIVVGAGGTGNAGTTTGVTGGSSSFASFLSATGGAGGTSGPGNAGVGYGGQVNLIGGRGEDLESNNYYAQGGASPFGGIGYYQGAMSPGGGGSATSSYAVIGTSGANGADGMVEFTY